MRFVDTNILLYAISNVAAHSAKTQAAQRILVDRDWGVSVQVLQEFYTQATRESRRGGIPHSEAMEFLREVRRRPVQPITLELFDAAVETARRFGLSYWDAAIIEAARARGCRVLLSEDLNSGQSYGGVRVVNPFA